MLEFKAYVATGDFTSLDLQHIPKLNPTGVKTPSVLTYSNGTSGAYSKEKKPHTRAV